MKSNTTKARLVFSSVVAIGLILAGLEVRGGEKTDQETSGKIWNGKFSILTYNVAGLPEPLSGSSPIRNMPQISPRLNDFDLVVTQEDFAYHRKLRAQDRHPYYAPRNRKSTLGDGLSRFSKFPMSEVQHTSWEKCYGYLRYSSDCMTAKGFSFARHELAPGLWLDLYDLHLDAGDSPGDNRAREAEVEQLLAALAKNSAGRAIIVAGDFNLERNAPDQAVLEQLLAGAHLSDTCRSLGPCPERIDRVLFRSSEELTLKPVAYKVETERFADKKGRQLSDHEAVSAVFEWRSVQK